MHVSTTAPPPWRPPVAQPHADRPASRGRAPRDEAGWGPYLNLSQRLSDPDSGPAASTKDVIDVEFATDGRAGQTGTAFGRYVDDNLAWNQWYSIKHSVEERTAAAALHDAILGSGLLELTPVEPGGLLPVDHLQIRFNRVLEDGTEEELTFRSPTNALPEPFVRVIEAVELYQSVAGDPTPEF